MPRPQTAVPIFTIVLAVALFAGCRPESNVPSPSAPARSVHKSSTGANLCFEELTGAGIEFVYQNGEEAGVMAILESLGGGVAIWDFDQDGGLDLFFPGGGSLGLPHEINGRSPALYRNTDRNHYIAVTELAGVTDAPYYSHGATVSDFDNDGFPDLVVTGYGGVLLWHNQGDGSFREIATTAGIVDPSWSSSAGWADLNGDNCLDLYLAHYVDWSFENNPRCPGPEPGQQDVCPPRRFEGLTDAVFYSNGDGTFRDATAEAGLVEGGKGLGVLLGDFDLDHDTDIYVANDTTANFLYLNDGTGRLTENGLLSGVAMDDLGHPNGSMGVAVGDYNADGRPDLWVANYENETFGLYRNEGNAQFLHVSKTAGVNAFGSLFVGFGTAFADLDRDGDEDLAVSNGHVIKYPLRAPVRQEPLVLVNDDGFFTRQIFSPRTYLGQPHYGRGLAVGDLDEDGALDLAVSHCNEPVALLRNCSEPQGDWLSVRLIGTVSNRDGVGAWAVLQTTAGEQLRLVVGGGSYLSQNDLRLFWGIPKGTQAQSLTVHWPSGAVQEVEVPAVNRTMTVIEAGAR